MNYNQLGNSGLIVSALCLGTMSFGHGTQNGVRLTFDDQKAAELVNAAIDEGINFIDTADVYGHGETEKILGRALGKRRNEIILATKASFRSGDKTFDAGVNAKHLIQQCHNSLKNLNTDFIDLFLLHNDDPITPIEETLKTLEQLVNQGKVRYVGVSNYQAWKVSAMVQRQKDLHYTPFVASQMHYSILNREVERAFIPMSLYHGLGMMVWSPLSNGFLTGKYTRAIPQPPGARLNDFTINLFDRELGYKVMDKITQIAREYEATPAAVAIAWLLAKKAVSSVIVGVSKKEQLKDNLMGTKLKLAQSTILEIDELTRPEVKYPELYITMQDEVQSKSKRY